MTIVRRALFTENIKKAYIPLVTFLPTGTIHHQSKSRAQPIMYL